LQTLSEYSSVCSGIFLLDRNERLTIGDLLELADSYQVAIDSFWVKLFREVLPFENDPVVGAMPILVMFLVIYPNTTLLCAK
jgi:hypothetical protein